MSLTGSTAAIFFQATRIGKCKNLSFNTEREILPTTKQGEIDRTFIAGLRNTTGSADFFYDPLDSGAVNVLNALYDDTLSSLQLEIFFDTYSGKKASGLIIFTNAGISVAYGAAQACAVQFQFSGKPLTLF